MAPKTSCFLVVFSLSICVGASVAQDQPPISEQVPLTVQPGVPIQIALEKSLPIKRAGVPVEGRVVEPVYVFDHLVIPAGTKVLGHLTQVEELSRKRRALTIANGDFTPPRKAHLDFDALVLNDGRQLPLDTVVSQGIPKMVHVTVGEEANENKGGVSAAAKQARQEVRMREHEAVKRMTAPDRTQQLKAAFAAELPYHKQSLPTGTEFTAELRSPLEFGAEAPSPKELEQLGGEIPLGSVVHARLTTPLSSATDHRGKLVQAVVSQPVFASDHALVLPEGTRLEGSVTQSVPARRLGRNGQLRFTFHKIDMPASATPRKVEASLEGVDSSSAAHMKLDAEGGAHAVTPKTKFIAPAIDVMLATSSLDGLDPHRRLHPDFHQGPDVAGGAVRGGAGFGLIGTVVGVLAHWRPVSAVFAFYGAGWSVYSHVVARGNDVIFSKGTPMEILFGTHEGSVAPPAKNKPAVSGLSKPANPS